MAWIQNNNNHNKQDKVSEVVENKPSINLTEFLNAEGLENWPLLESFEKLNDYTSDGILNGTQNDIVSLLEEAAALRLDLFDKIEETLSNIEAKLNLHANQIVIENKKPRTFMIDMSESDVVKSYRSSKRRKSLDLTEMLLETRKKSLDYFKFPEFVHGQLIELPSKLDVLTILSNVSAVQNFNPGFRKFWTTIFLSEASIAVFQDSFWWIFLDKFNKEEGFDENKDLLFDRIADSYAALFTSINMDVKDKFMAVYPDCLSQTLYSAYKEAFPESKLRFDEDFKQYVINLIYEWVTGLHPTPGTWNSWNEEGLKLGQTTTYDEATKKVLEAAAVNMKVESSLDMEACTKVIDKLGTQDCDSPQGNNNKENTKTSRVKFESHQIGPGPEFGRVEFNISGRSPLISHYLHMLQLRSDQQPGINVKRTEIVKFPPENITYQQFITSTLNRCEALKKDYTRTHEQTSADILDLKRWQRDTNKEMNALKKALTNSKNAQERCLAIEAIMEYSVKERSQKGVSLIEIPETVSNSSTSCDEDET